MQYRLTNSGTRFLSIEIEITQFPDGFRLKLQILAIQKNYHGLYSWPTGLFKHLSHVSSFTHPQHICQTINDSWCHTDVNQKIMVYYKDLLTPQRHGKH